MSTAPTEVKKKITKQNIMTLIDLSSVIARREKMIEKIEQREALNALHKTWRKK